jgi:pimeloyl-ACP methyl ester carboxylesterase
MFRECISMTTNDTNTKTTRKRGCLFYLKRGIKWIGILIAAIIILGISFQTIASEIDRRSYMPPGDMIDVDGHQMHLYCTGEGSPTIILEAGAYSFSPQWYWVQQQLEPNHRVCSYDRAGNGWSEPVEGMRDGLTLVRELHSLLQQADIEGPFVMVGHSLGGVLATIYAAEYPDDVLGLVVVDSAVPRRWADYAEFEQFLTDFPNPYMLMTLLTRVGVIRLILPPEFQSYGYPAEITAVLTAFKATPQGVDTWNAEVRAAQWELSRQLYTVPNLGDVPIIVLWASNPDFKTPEERALLTKIWGMLPTFSDNSVVQIIDGATHGSIVGNEQYAQHITDAVSRIIASAQTGEPLEHYAR